MTSWGLCLRIYRRKRMSSRDSCLIWFRSIAKDHLCTIHLETGVNLCVPLLGPRGFSYFTGCKVSSIDIKQKRSFTLQDLSKTKTSRLKGSSVPATICSTSYPLRCSTVRDLPSGGQYATISTCLLAHTSMVMQTTRPCAVIRSSAFTQLRKLNASSMSFPMLIISLVDWRNLYRSLARVNSRSISALSSLSTDLNQHSSRGKRRKWSVRY